MKNFIFSLRQIFRHNRDGSHKTQADREQMLILIGKQLDDLGYRLDTAGSLKPKHVEALVTRWTQEELSPGSIKNRMSVLRWLSCKIGKQGIIAHANEAYGIADRQPVTNEDKGRTLTEGEVAAVSDPHTQMSLRLQAAFGLRREESIKFQPEWADRGDRPRYRWQQAVERWLAKSAAHASLEDSKIHLRWVHRFLFDVTLDAIDRNLLDKIVQARRAEGVANATVNRLLEIIRVILRRAAQDWEWIDRVPAIRLLPEPTRRIRWLTREEAERLLKVLPPHTEALTRFSLATGLRERNVTRLEWTQVDLTRRMAWIHPDQAKAKKPIAVPLNNEAVLVLTREVGKHPTRVFTWHGRPIDTANTRAWRRALKQVGIESFRWHDLRHTWASWHVQNGTPLHVLQELSGWACFAMVQRYAHLSAEHLAEYAGNVSKIRAVSSTLLGTPAAERDDAVGEKSF